MRSSWQYGDMYGLWVGKRKRMGESLGKRLIDRFGKRLDQMLGKRMGKDG